MSPFIAWCRRYISVGGIAVLAAIAYIIFFQDNSMARIYGYDQTIDSLEQVIAEHRDSLNYYRSLNMRLDQRDPEIIERVVRENHNMNRIDEDVYLYE